MASSTAVGARARSPGLSKQTGDCGRLTAGKDRSLDMANEAAPAALRFA
jgi:hypothetical protein